MRKILLALGIVVMLALVALAGCTDEGDDKSSSYLDAMGNSVFIDGIPKRIITLAPSLTEIALELGLKDRLVGYDEASANVPNAPVLQQVMTWQGLDLESTVALEPDIVFMDKTLDMSGDTYAALSGVEITTFVFFPKSLEDMISQIVYMGQICDRESAADGVRGALEKRINDVASASAGYTDKPKVLYVTYYDGVDNPWVGTDSTMSADLISKAGGENMVHDATGYVVQIGLESIIAEDPDIIITSQSSIWPTTSRQAILDDDTLKDVSAVKNGRVFDIDGDLVDRPGPRMVDGLEEMNGHVEDFVNA